MSFAEFQRKVNPIKHPVGPKRELKWKVGGRFMRPTGHLLSNKRLVITRIEYNRVYGPDDLWTSKHWCTLFP